MFALYYIRISFLSIGFFRVAPSEAAGLHALQEEFQISLGQNQSA